MRTNLLVVFFLTVVFFSCSVPDQKKIINIIAEFEKENIPDKRETIFDIRTSIENGNLILTGETENPSIKNQLLAELSNIEFIERINILPDSTVGDKIFGLINLSVANLRTFPNHSAELATQALLGTPVKILKSKDGWYQVKTPDKYISWVDDGGIFPLTEMQLTDWKNSERILFSGDNASVFGTSRLEKPVSDLVMGNILEKTGETENTIIVKLPDGRTGFVSPENWVNFNEFKTTVKAEPDKIKELAEQFTGRPYLWGGTSARAMDCSGFVKTLYFMNGIILARDASLQTRHGELIETSASFHNLEIGDLLFFGKKEDAKYGEKVTHVALSLSGTEYIHASGRIKKNSFNPESVIFSEYRKNSFVRARRIMGSEGNPGIQQLKEHPWY